jgi:hypothetical protein
MLLRGDIENATINMGISLIFDPFDQKIKWQGPTLIPTGMAGSFMWHLPWQGLPTSFFANSSSKHNNTKNEKAFCLALLRLLPLLTSWLLIRKKFIFDDYLQTS